MGSTKKKKDKDRERDRDEVSKSSRKRKHKSKSRSPPSSPTHSASKISKKSSKKHREKRKHSESEDSDVPLTKTSKIVARSGSASPGEIVDDVSPPKRAQRSPSPPPRGRRSPSPPPQRIRSSPPRGRRSPSPVRRGRRSPSPPPRGRRSPSPPPKSSGGGDSLSIEETNRLRIKLGLKPLQVESGPPPTAPPPKRPPGDDELEEGEEEFDEETLQRIRDEREKEADTFWKEKQDFVHAPAENITEKLQADKIREKIKAVREKRRLEERLAGVKALADDADEDLDDASKWVERQKKAAEAKALAEKRAKALADLDDEFGVGDVIDQEYERKKNNAYTGRDLTGIKVLHSQDRIIEGETVILTLKDKDVLNEDDDTLVNVNMIDDEKYEKNVEDRRLRPEFHGYNAFDEIEFDNDGNLKQKGVLAKYDEEIDKGSGVKSFTLGSNVSEEARKAKIREKMQKADKILESLESSHLKLASDFYTPDEMVAFKKPRKKVKKVRKVLRADDILKLSSSNPAASSSSSSKRDLGSRKRKETEEEEDDHGDTIKTEPVDMDVELDVNDLPPAPDFDDFWTVKVDDEADMDFQMALTKARKLQQRKDTKKQTAEHIVENMKRELEDDAEMASSSRASGNIVLHATAEFCRTLGDIPSEGVADIYADEEMDFEQDERAAAAKLEERGRWAEVEIDETPVDITREPDVEDVPILEQEPDVGTGIGGALKLAMKKGYLDQVQQKRGVAQGQMKHLEAKNYSIEDKNYEDERIHKRDMYCGPVSEFKEKDGYRPDVKLDYVDDDGRTISSKEAFRLLSHKFHGKGSGKNKVDKKRRKIEQMKLMQQMNSTDTPLGTLELLQQKQKESQSAYIVLTGKSQTALAKSKR